MSCIKEIPSLLHKVLKNKEKPQKDETIRKKKIKTVENSMFTTSGSEDDTCYLHFPLIPVNTQEVKILFYQV